MARLYADENFPLPVVEELRQLGHDVLTMPRATDQLDFLRLGLIQCRIVHQG